MLRVLKCTRKISTGSLASAFPAPPHTPPTTERRARSSLEGALRLLSKRVRRHQGKVRDRNENSKRKARTQGSSAKR
eukprot:4234340-Alexandrium_andersonii.AAC.1